MKKKITAQFIIQAVLVVALLLYAVLAFAQGKKNTIVKKLPNILHLCG